MDKPIPICVSVRYWLLSSNWLLVRIDIELDEENKIARKQRAAKDSGRFRSMAVAERRELRPVGAGKVGIG
jgi:hypothetical protein